MKNLRWQILIALGGLALVVGLLLGQSPGAAPGVSQPVQGGAYSEALVGALQRLNPVLDFAHPVDRDIDRLLFRGLVSFDSRGVPQPDLAESWAVSADARLYTFFLRPEAVWHDGEPVTADDVVYTFSLLQDPAYPGPADLQEFWEQVSILRLDELAVQFQLPEPFAPFLDYVSLGLLPDHLLRGVTVARLVDHPFHLEPVGTGPFRFTSYLVEGERIRGVSLEAFDDFYGEPPFLERLEFHLFDTASDAWEAYTNGEVQGLGDVGEDLLAAALDSPTLNLYSARMPRTAVIFLNVAHPDKTFLAEKKVRQALLHALNREWLIRQALGGQGVVAGGPILEGTWASPDGAEPAAYDPALAAQLLGELEWQPPIGASSGSPEYLLAKDEQTLSFALAHSSQDPWPLLAEAIRADWAMLGVQVELVPLGPDEILTDLLQARDFEAVLTELNFSRFPDPDPYPFWHDSQIEEGQNYAGFNDRNISIWLEQARTTPDLGRRAELYRSFAHRFQDQVPALLLFHPVYSYAVDNSILGISVGPLWDASDRFLSVTGWYLRARRSGSPDSTSAP